MLGRSLMMSGAVRRVAVRKLSAVVAESPRETVARNILLLNEIAGAKDEAALAKVASATLPAVDFKNLPAELADVSAYFSTSGVSVGTKFIPDPKAWQNMSFSEFAQTEVMRNETFPFFMGFIVVNLLLGFGLASVLPKEMEKTSKYAQLIERNSGKAAPADAHGHHSHH